MFIKSNFECDLGLVRVCEYFGNGTIREKKPWETVAEDLHEMKNNHQKYKKEIVSL